MILAFDTSAAHVTAALLDGDRVLTRHEDMARGQAERLIPLLEELLAEAGADWKDLTRIGVGIGPGNFTGIRISVAAARGLAQGLGIPAVGVSSLEALAFGTEGPTTVLVQAPREQVYLQHFDSGQALEAPMLSTLLDVVDNRLSGTPTYIGAFAAALADDLGGSARQPLHPQAEAIARITALREDVTTRPAPLYLKPADAAPSREAPPVILDDA